MKNQTRGSPTTQSVPPPITQAIRHPKAVIIQAISGSPMTPESPENTHLMLIAVPRFFTNQLVRATSRGMLRPMLIPVAPITAQTSRKDQRESTKYISISPRPAMKIPMNTVILGPYRSAM